MGASKPKNAVTLEQAKEWISNWQKRTDISGTEIKAYLIPHKDISDIQKEKGWINYRAYNAITNEGEFKLLIVGVDDNGDDLVNYFLEENASGDDYVYDMTTPCPSVCSANQWWG